MFNFKKLKKMSLENLNLVELDAQEVQETEGGFWGEVGAGLLLYGILSAIEYPDAFLNGLKGN